METQNIINVLNGSSNQESKFGTKKWYVIDSQTTKGKWKQSDTIKFETETIKSSPSDYSDAFILVTGNITVNAANDTNVVFKHCAKCFSCKRVINDVFLDRVEHLYIAMPMYNLIEYSDYYSGTSGSLWQFKRDESLLIMLIWVLIILNLLNTKQPFLEKQQIIMREKFL